MAYGNGRNSYNSGNRSGRMPAFSSMASKWALAIGMGAAALGAYEGVQAMRASSWQDDASAAIKSVAGASAIKGRELAVLAKREASSSSALSELDDRSEAMEFLVGSSVSGLAASRANLVAQERARIESSAAAESSLAAVLAAKSTGKISNSDFIDAAMRAMASLPKEAAPFAGPEGFASDPLAAFEAKARAMGKEADEKLALLKEELPARAKLLDEESSQKSVDKMSAQAVAEAKEAAGAEAEQQIEGYREQVKNAAQKAFDSEGESMGSSDWDSINNDLESDGDWQSAKQGLRASADASAQQAGALARDQWDDEREHAVALAQAVSAQPDAVSHMSIWEMAMLAQWIDMSSPRTAVVYSAPMQQVGIRYASQRSLVAMPMSSFARQGYSMGAEPKAGLDGASALRMSRGEDVQAPRPRYAGSAAAASIASTVAVGRGDMGKVARLSAVGKAPMAPVQIQGSPAAGKYVQSAAPGQARDYAQRAPAAFAWSSSASSVAARAAQSASSKAASVAATSAVRSAAGKAAQSAAQGAAAKASSMAASKAAQSAAGTVAAKAAQNAAQSAASRAAQSAAAKAASSAASKAATAAASKAASKAASAASQRAAQSASSRASQSSSRSSGSSRR